MLPLQSWYIAVLFTVNIGLLWYITTIGTKPEQLKPQPSKKFPHLSEVEAISPFIVNEKFPIDIANASAIFNTVQSTLKSKDSNIHAVGVSFIPAYIPANTRLYHSRGNSEIPNLFEWIAFDHEFSHNFARFTRSVKGEDGDEDGGNMPWGTNNYLLTFRTKRPLDKVILLDGSSAAKISPEMDQQMILSRQENTSAPVNERWAAQRICKWGKKFGLQGYIRLEVSFEMVLCDFFEDVELIANTSLSVANDLIEFPPDDPKYTPEMPGFHHPKPRPSGSPGGPPPGGHPPKFPPPPPSQQRYMGYDVDTQDVSAKGLSPPQYDSLAYNRSLLLSHISSMMGYEWALVGADSNNGDRRILLDYSKMVTPLNQTYIDPDVFKRNISYISPDLKENIIHSLEDVYEGNINPFTTTDWQVITNTISMKFAPILSSLNTTLHVDSAKVASDRIQLLTFGLIRLHLDANLKTWEQQKQYAYKKLVESYVYHTYPLSGSDNLIYSSIFKVHSEIIKLLLDLFEASRKTTHSYYLDGNYEKIDLEPFKKRIADMLSLFNWSYFYQCQEKCGPDLFCFTPTWGPSPFGWGPSSQKDLFDYDGETYRIRHDLICYKYNDGHPLPELN